MPSESSSTAVAPGLRRSPAPAAGARAPAVSGEAPALVELAGWGANTRADCAFVEPETRAQIRRRMDPAGTTPRGLGRSYGDPAVNTGGTVLGLRRHDRYLAFDEASGTLTCEAGVSLEQIIADFAPRGFFPMITPGTQYVTVGGCIANDVHGKAHHEQGSFERCVDSMELLLASGECVTASREHNADLFWASFGGMGLLGVVLTATIRLRPIETTYFRRKPVVVRDLDGMLAALEENDRIYPYSVAVVDPAARGKRLGAGVLNVGDHATRAELTPELARDPLKVAGRSRLFVPFELPEITLNPLSIRLISPVLKAVQASTAPFAHYQGFFYPLDAIQHWNRCYGRRGFTQYQFVIPFEDGERNVRNILEAIMSSGALPFLNVLKRMGKGSEGHLSFPREGYTFAIDFPVRNGLEDVCHKLDRMVLDAGGRIYLGKDSYVQADTFRAMYPRLDEWLAIKARVDPHGQLTSDLARRVGLMP